MQATSLYTAEHAERQHAINCFHRAIRTPEFKKLWPNTKILWACTHLWVRDPDTGRITVRNGQNVYYHNADGSAFIRRSA